MIVGIILLLLGVFLLFMAGVGTNDYDSTASDSTSAARTITALFGIGAILLVAGGYRMDDYIWPPETKTEAISER